MLDRNELFIDGTWTAPASGEHGDVIEAATEKVLGRSALAGPADIDAAVAAARAALDGPWGSMSRAERADLLDRFAAAMTARARGTAELVSRENGMPISLAKPTNGYGPAAMLSYYAGLIRSAEDEEVRPGALGGRTVVRSEPVGVVAAITPWNYPQPLAAMKIAPALAAGCTVVLKPAPETALDAFVFADAAQEAGLPAGVLNVVPGGREAGAHLVGHPGVDKVAFTGSTVAGRAIGEVCGRLLRPVTLELGGKSAAIVAEDADLGVFADHLLEVSLVNNGQTCHASTRILAPRSRYGEVVDAVTETVRALRVGDPLDKTTAIGPLVSAAQRERVLGHIESGRADGYQITTGGGVPADLAQGWFVEPTVFAGVDNSASIAQEEIFGPVLTITEYADTDDAVRIANDSVYGLGGTVWTADEERGLELARRIRTGTVGVNHYALDLTAPFGGVKASGLGRELGPEGLAPYLAPKSVYFATR
ncbi:MULTISPECIES: aldehyde dehydrogenase [Gordonia]|uniref:Aldehyde dehydrogenase n=1 Tax=Gordonia amicalis TaxID=89053 RepID=A0ABU4DDZ3_9ACTN|nr:MULTISPECIES: aldehyde dehydrogenase [Gordonia]ATD69378.1 aldehyde dehydrogenase [Gordonia sp. 1D]MCR8898090.1 aldehyde dehydrogenase [Gordonia sp. GONU]MDJ0451898.1 aldehyde dehydrogenase [Gordonia amicalis]MDV6307953.1 aldehyde dehydrogenase [Gordonia amicalis]MDV7076162.1 aldehyde dehydrogenase [Gordonia amicalis]